MKKIFNLFLLVLAVHSQASTNNIEDLISQWDNERTTRNNSIEWIGKDRIESRDNIQNRLIEKIYVGEFNESQIKELIRNSRVSVESIRYVEANKNKLIDSSKCISDSCNDVLWDAYVKKSDECYLNKKF